MKKTFFLFAIILFSNVLMAQNFTELAAFNFKNKESYTTEIKNVLLCTDYMFNNPVDANKQNRLIATQFIMKWMEGTSDYTFEIGPNVMELTDENSDLFALYLAAMTKVVLENKGDKLSNDQIYAASEALLVAYCENSDNNLKPSKKIKKIIKSKKG